MSREAGATIRQFVGFNPSRAVPVAVGEWGPFVFVNVDSAADALFDVMRPLTTAMAPHDVAGFVIDGLQECSSRRSLASVRSALISALGEVVHTAESSSGTLTFRRCRVRLTLRPYAGSSIEVYWVEPNLGLFCLADRIIAAFIRSLGGDECHITTAVVSDRAHRGSDGEETAPVHEAWRALLDS